MKGIPICHPAMDQDIAILQYLERRSFMHDLQLHCDLTAPREVVFDTWLNQFEQGNITEAIAFITPRVEGGFRLWGGAVTGQFMAIERPHTLVMTWRTVEFEEWMSDTKLTITFQETRKGSRFIVTHELIPLPMMRQFRFAWEDFYFPRLKVYFEARFPG